MGKRKKPEKLTKDDPEFYSKIARLAGQQLAREKGTEYFSKLAAKSHPRDHYNGGRPKKVVPAAKMRARKNAVGRPKKTK